MSLQSAMDAAQAAASNLPATIDNSSTALAPAPVLGTGLDDFLAGGMRPDKWIKVTEVGVWLDRTEKGFVEEFEGVLDIGSIQLFHGLRAEFAGNQVKYAKSYDGGRTTTQGESFNAVAADFKANAVKFTGNYRGADMLIIVDEEITQGKTTIPVGTKLGYSTPVTGFAPFQSLLKELAAQGLVQDAGGGRLSGTNVRIKVTHTSATNATKQDYGVLTLELLGPVTD